ncbi:MAG: hypothetical protein ACHREM_27895 [Polyangiales bacterium]
MRASSKWVTALAAAVAMAASWSCDPVHNNAIAALGPEDPSVPKGPLHRPGQDCNICHGGSGPGGKAFVAAGTVYAAYDDAAPLNGATIVLTDANGYTPPQSMLPITTNAAGNFYITTDDWAPTFPVSVAVTYKGVATPTQMFSHMGKAGSCAKCHQGAATASTTPETQSTVAQVYFANTIKGFTP